jgi:senataxin
LNSFPPGAHLFCAKRNDDDIVDYDNPDSEEDDISITQKHRLIAEGQKRRKVAYQFSLVFALSAEDVGEWQQAYVARVAVALTECDRCVRNYHMWRKPFLKELSE